MKKNTDPNMAVEVSQKSSSVIPDASVPIIDFISWTDRRYQNRIVEEVAKASAQYGIFRVVGSGVLTSVIDDCLVAAKKFYSLDRETKLKSSATNRLAGFSIRDSDSYSQGDSQERHLKEVFNLGPPDNPFWRNVYPEIPSGFRACADAYYREIERLEGRLFEAFSLALASLIGLQLPASFLGEEKGRHRGLLRFNYYPKCLLTPDPYTFRDAPHTDWSPFTILFAEKEGLEVLQKNEWKRVPVEPLGFIVIIGNQLNWWSNGRFSAAVHRVSAVDCCLGSRISFTFFSSETIDPTDDRITGPFCAPGERPIFEPFSIRDYIAENFARLGHEIEAPLR